MKIKINGIYGKYNNELDFDNKCTIFIGENGIGKSTTMKILRFILKRDFLHILNNDFESIEIINNDQKVVINYTDLFPSIDDAIELCSTYKETFNCNAYVEYGSKKYGIEVKTSEVLKTLEKLSEITKNDNRFFKDIIKEVYMNNTRLFRLPDKGYSIKLRRKSLILNKDINVIFGVFHVFNELLLDKGLSDRYNYYDKTLFSINKIYELLDNILDISDCVFMLSMVKELKMSDEINYKIISSRYCITTNYDIKELPEYYQFIFNRESINSEVKREDLSKLDYLVEKEEKLSLLKTLFERKSVEDIVNKTEYGEVNASKKKFSSIALHSVLNDDFNINSLLLNNYYTKEQVQEFVNDYYTMLKKMVNKEYKDEELNYECYFKSEVLKRQVELLIIPLIPYASFFHQFHIDKMESYEEKVFNKFLVEEARKFINFRSEKIDKLNALFDKYFKNKKVYCSPVKIVISFDDKNFAEDLELENLSEGERRIIILFTIGILNSNTILLLDEPETSLSVVWQKELINDLLENTNSENIIVATQSPFIVYDDELLDYVVCLPGDEYHA